MDALVRLLLSQGVLLTQRLKDAFLKTDRKDFVPPDFADDAYKNIALPIGEGQTISQPYTVAVMLELLDVREGNVILEIGSGSGWQSVLLARLVDGTGKVYAMELIPRLYEMSRTNATKYPEVLARLEFFCQNAKHGLPHRAQEHKGFDRIIAAAEVAEVPYAWREQVRRGGILMYPRAGSLWKETKVSAQSFEKEEYPGFVFVPFVA